MAWNISTHRKHELWLTTRVLNKDHENSVHIVELHKQEYVLIDLVICHLYSILTSIFDSLLQYNILDTIDSSATKARVLFKDIWCDMIRSFEAVLESNSELIQDEENGKAEEVKIYASNILKTTVSKYYS